MAMPNVRQDNYVGQNKSMDIFKKILFSKLINHDWK